MICPNWNLINFALRNQNQYISTEVSHRSWLFFICWNWWSKNFTWSLDQCEQKVGYVNLLCVTWFFLILSFFPELLTRTWWYEIIIETLKAFFEFGYLSVTWIQWSNISRCDKYHEQSNLVRISNRFIDWLLFLC